MAEKKENKAAKDINLGRIQAAVWENKDGKGGVWYNVTVTRGYKDGEKWNNATSFSRDDLPTVRQLVDMAHFWICKKQVVFSEDGEE